MQPESCLLLPLRLLLCLLVLQRDVAILEEPEHLNWFNHSKRWCHEFQHVVGIM
jgi:hypothetical protein